MTTPTRAQLAHRLRTEGPHALRIVIAAVVGWQICRWIDPDSLPIYAVIVPLVAMREDPYSAFNTSFDRLIGVVAGILIGIGIASWLGPSIYAIALVLLVGLTGGIILRIGPSLNIQVSLSALLVFANPAPGELAVARLWETLVGGAVTVVLSPLLFPPDPRAAVLLAYDDVIGRVARQLSELSVAVGHANQDAPRLAALREAALETEGLAEALPGKLSGAQRSVQYNPLRRAHRPSLQAMGQPVAHLVSVAQALRVLVDDVTEFSARPDIAPTWERFGSRLSRVLSQAATAATGLSPDGLTPAARSALATAGDEIARWRDASKSPLDAVLRRPAYRMVHTLEAFEG